MAILHGFTREPPAAGPAWAGPRHAPKPQRLLQSRNEGIGKRGGRKNSRQSNGETSIIAKGVTRYGTTQMIRQLPYSQTERTTS
jgi:hypothetical protein